MKIAVYGLIYGNYHPLHKRFVTSLREALPSSEIRNGSIKVTIWGNEPCEQTKTLMNGIPEFGWHPSVSNTPKYTLMREKMFSLTDPDDFDWMVWFDDDSWLTDPGRWWRTMMEFIETRKVQNVCYIGEPWFWCWWPGQWEFVTQSKWFKGLPVDKDKKGRARVEFAQGGLWWLRSDLRKQLEWPDHRLSHNGGDTLLGEAVRQQGLPFHKVYKKIGFLANHGARRGRREKPAGAK